MTVGIIGAGNIGGAFATALGKAGIEAVIANSRGPESLTALVSKLGSTIRAGSVQEAAAQAIVLVAVPWSKIPGALAGLNFGDRIVIDANNSIEAPLYRPADLGGRTSTDIFTALVPGARRQGVQPSDAKATVGRPPIGRGQARPVLLRRRYEGEG